MGHNKFGVNLDALADAEKGVRNAANELTDMAGWGASSLGVGGEGMGLQAGLALGPDTVGHAGLAMALSGFAESWEWGIRYLVDDGMDAAEALGETRSTYEQIEDGVVSLLKQGMHATMGDPSQSHTAWQDKSFGEIAATAAPAYVTQPAEQMLGRDFTGDGQVGGDMARKAEEAAPAPLKMDINQDGKLGE